MVKQHTGIATIMLVIIGRALVLCFRNTAFGAVDASAVRLDSWSISLVAGIVALVLAFSPLGVKRLFLGSKAFVAVTALGTLGLALRVAQAGMSLSPAFQVVGIVAIACYYTFGSVYWLLRMTQFRMTLIFIVLAVSDMLSYGLGIGIGLAPTTAATLVLFVALWGSVACALALASSGRRDCDAQETVYSLWGLVEAGHNGGSRGRFASMVVLIAGISFLQALITNSGAARAGTDFAGSLLAGAVMLVYVLAFRRKLRLTPIYQLALPCLCLGIASFLAADPATLSVGYAATGMGFTLVFTLVFAVICNGIYRFRSDPIWALCVLRGSIALPRALGMLLVSTGTMPDPLSVGPHAIIITLVAVIVFHQALLPRDDFAGLLQTKDVGAETGTAAGPGDSTDGTDSGTGVEGTPGRRVIAPTSLQLGQACLYLSREFGLTRREEDVLALLAQRKTNAQIAEEMVVSDATVKSHVQHIYRKLGVHSRKQLEEVVEIRLGKR